MKQRKFEVPYNFNADFIEKMKPYVDYIDSVYIPMYYFDGLTTRIFYQIDWYPKSKEAYEEHLQNLINNGMKPNILIQDPIKDFDEKLLKWYIDRGVKHFTVYQDKVAEMLRKIDPTVKISASITKKLTPEEIELLPVGLYDNIILHFAYNHSLDIIKSLRKDLDYTLVANVECHQDCWGTHHWYQTLQYNEEDNTWTPLAIPRMFHNVCKVPADECAVIYPEYLHYYDDYIQIYKLVDRTFPTDRILMFLKLFSNMENNLYIENEYLNRNNIKFFKQVKFLPNEI